MKLSDAWCIIEPWKYVAITYLYDHSCEEYHKVQNQILLILFKYIVALLSQHIVCFNKGIHKNYHKCCKYT